MYRVGKWLDRGRALATASTHSLDSLAESQNMETALAAVELVMNDDIQGAEKGLADGNSAFHKLAKGTLAFMRAALGFEQEVMKEASELLYEAETSASTSYYKAQQDSRVFQSAIYDRGSEFALCQAEAQIMSAVVAVLNESLTESIRGFYKLRKAYITLEGLAQMETNFVKARGVKSLTGSREGSSDSLNSMVSSKSIKSDIITASERVESHPEASHSDPGLLSQPSNPSGLRNAQGVDDIDDEDDSGDEFYEADTIRESNPVTHNYAGHLATSTPQKNDSVLEQNLDKMNLNDNENLMKVPSTTPSMNVLNIDADSEIFTSSLDVFIHSGTNLMSGMLSLLISIIPPAFSRLLHIIGFRGDRERGIRMLWQASKFPNINGGMAALVLFGWYNGLANFYDIVFDFDPTNPYDVEGYPAARLEKLLAEMRRRYPQSRLWLIEEARAAAARRQLSTALNYLSQPAKSQIRQIEAFGMFEKSLNASYAHDYSLCASSFLACVDLNAWSQSMYYYNAGAAHLASYRHSPNLSPKEKEKHKKLAEEYFKTAPTKIGKKKMLGRQLPFDAFVVRKLAKWEERAQRFHVDFIDAIGVSPLEEMTFFWNGFKRMNAAQLQESLENLAWSEQQPSWTNEDADEIAVLALLRAVILRNLRHHNDSIEVLSAKILSQDNSVFKGNNKDDWVAPAAYHEYAVNLWMQRTGYCALNGTTFEEMMDKQSERAEVIVDLARDAHLVAGCRKHLEKAKNWEKYELDARLGMKITAALSAVVKWEEKFGKSVK